MKIGRAYEHLQQLKAEISKYREDPYLISRHDDLENSRHRVRIENRPTIDLLGLLPGEFAYCLRSGLDNLAWQLALLTTDQPRRDTCFPIDSKEPSATDKTYGKRCRDIPDRAIEVIDSLQPYKAGAAFKDHPLWQLNKLCNMDKHRVVAFSSLQFNVRIDGVHSAWRRDTNNAIEISIPLAEKDNLKLDIGVPDAVFGDPIDRSDAPSDFEVSLDRLAEIYEVVRFSVLPRFEVFFQ
jgi:hypothetical protein